MKKGSKQFNPNTFEAKWQSKWESDNTFSPDLDTAKRPYYTLMMFPYPSAEGMHVGNMYAHTGADIHGRFKRMLGHDVFEPIGLDGFGIHSENYAMKVGRHPKDQAKRSEENFYRQMHATGAGFDWHRTLETYDPEYYKWTQWLFIQMFKAGLAYKDTASVNYCPSCKTVLSDEQVVAGECERCGTIVEKRELEQWFFRITRYAGRLLDNIPKLDWSPKVKTAQTKWIGRSKGALITFPIADFRLPNGQKPNYVLLHGLGGSPEKNFLPWLSERLEKLGFNVYVPELPNSDKPNIEEQVAYLLENYTFNENTIIVAHSLGGVLALKLLPKLKKKVAKVVFAASPIKNEFVDGAKRPELDTATDWLFDFSMGKSKVDEIVVLSDITDTKVPMSHGKELAQKLNARLVETNAEFPHFIGKTATIIFNELVTHIDVFTTRPDTLFGATFMVISPEHPIVKNILDREYNLASETVESVEKYVTKAANKTESERIADDKVKDGVFSGLYTVNPASGDKIPVWIADYVLAGYGTGAIMAVPAHDARDYAFAQKYKLPIVPVIQTANESNSEQQSVYVGAGLLQNSGDWNGYHSTDDIDKITAFISENGIGLAQEQYHLRDWLISRQRYWGPPIPMIYCQVCAEAGKSWFTTEEALVFASTKSQAPNTKQSQNSKAQTIGNSQAMPGWYPVPETDLPVLLPDIEDFKPKGSGTSPLADHPEFYETRCPECKGKATRETDVSDTFLDSSWYFLRYLATEWDDRPFPSKELAKSVKRKSENQSEVGSRQLAEKIEISQERAKFLPVSIYIGGAEHSVLHLLYARFVTMMLYDLGYLDFEEPFKKFYAHGLLVKEGAKMSKSKGNVIIPDEYIDKYGADTLRSYLMFLGPFAHGGDFYDTGIEGMFRFLRRIWHLLMNRVDIGEEDIQLTRARHKTIAGVTEDMEDFGYNTSISKVMELYNLITEGKGEHDRIILSQDTVIAILKMLAPFAPHMTEEMWYCLNMGTRKQITENWSIHHSSWPTFDPEMVVDDSITIAVQVNGKRRGEIVLDRNEISEQSHVEEKAKMAVSKHLESGIRKVIYVPGKIINFVVN